ncbi:DNA repair exonuclease [uncultured Sphaerochaeta sp.]|uniref:metallophosphoesterase family protein n=1 Tax=uncultured Sphaerochaeta sp. TaxID=886478 RepID=UPI002A0A35A4|nr:DNA repair exonuclease [uncultured Sphaerochaeta sp.]
MRIIACSDIHIGRIPAVQGRQNLNGHVGWDAIVEKAIALEVDALVLSGDIVEKDNAWFEAYGPLVKGLENLKKAGIEVFAVAGNHDANIFPRLAKEEKQVHLLGLKGTWDHIDYNGVRFIGWSFPQSVYAANPLDSFDPSLSAFAGPCLGLLHCDVDGPLAGKYASVPSNQFEGTNLPLWVLGHIHAKKLINNKAAFYCGSPFALDSSETEEHGIWLLETVGEKSWKDPQFIQLSPWLFCNCEVSLEGITSLEELPEYITKAMREKASSKLASLFNGDLYCKLAFTGTVPLGFELQNSLTPENLQELVIPLEEGCSAYALDSFDDATTFQVDLKSLAQGVGPIALLAKQLLAMDTLPGLLDEVRDIEEKSHNLPAFQQLRNVAGPDMTDTPEKLVQKAGMILLRSMLKNIEGETV